ncbi:MAG: SUF system NifU family Fe-S cluster assembly protein [bacterium]|nr:SUF system NifU family Fe-S cluster assembly protein [bacterium]
MSIYQDVILDHYHSPRNEGRIKNPSNSVSLSNPLCGDTIVMDVVEKNGKIERIAHISTGCAISKASASMLTEYVKGKTKDEVVKLDKDFILTMLGIELSANRLRCALLPLESLHKLIK